MKEFGFSVEIHSKRWFKLAFIMWLKLLQIQNDSSEISWTRFITQQLRYMHFLNVFLSIDSHLSYCLHCDISLTSEKSPKRKYRRVVRQIDRQRKARQREKEDDREGGRRVEEKYFTSSRICAQIWSWARGNLCKIMLIRLYNMQGAATKQFYFFP